MANDAFLNLVSKTKNLLDDHEPFTADIPSPLIEELKTLGTIIPAEEFDAADYYEKNWSRINDWLVRNAPSYVMNFFEIGQERTRKLYRSAVYYKRVNAFLWWLVVGLMLSTFLLALY